MGFHLDEVYLQLDHVMKISKFHSPYKDIEIISNMLGS